MSVQYRKPTQKKKTQVAQSQVQPWHIVVFVMAVLVLGWFAFGYIREERAKHNVQVPEQKVPNPYPVGSSAYQKFEDK